MKTYCFSLHNSTRFIAPLALLLSMLVPAGLHAQESVPDWAKSTFSGASDRVFDAALASIATLKYQVQEKSAENKIVRFRVGRSAFSWGYLMVLKVSQGKNNASGVSIEVYRMRGPGSNGEVSLVASGKKEVQKLFQGIEKELESNSRTHNHKINSFNGLR